MNSNLNRMALPALVSALIVIILSSNVNILTFDALWHDDGLWFQRGVIDAPIPTWRGRAADLVPYNDMFYTWMMVNAGMEVSRFAYLILAILSAFVVAIASSRLLGLQQPLGVSAWLLALVLPGVVIPVGLNAAYPIIALFAFSIMLVVLWGLRALGARHPTWVSEILLSTILSYAAFSLFFNLSPLSFFYIPALFVASFFGLWGKWRPLLVFLVVGSFMALQNYFRQAQYSHKEAIWQSASVISERMLQLGDIGSVIPALGVSGFMVIAVLLAILIALLFFRRKELPILTPELLVPHAKVLFVGVALFLGQAFPFVVLSDTFRPHDYSYLANFGLVVCQIVLLSAVSFTLLWPFKARAKIAFYLVFLSIALCMASVKIEVSEERLARYEATSSELRGLLRSVPSPLNSQWIITGVPATNHPGNWRVNTGYLNFLMPNIGISGVVGPDLPGSRVFGPAKHWFDIMTGLEEGKPIIAFRRLGNGSYERVNSMVSLDRDESSLDFVWSIYDISDPFSGNEVVQNGVGLVELQQISLQLKNSAAPAPLFLPPVDELVLPAVEVQRLNVASAFDVSSILENGMKIGFLRSDFARDYLNAASMRLCILVDQLDRAPSLSLRRADASFSKNLQLSRYLSSGDLICTSIHDDNVDLLDIEIWLLSTWPHKKLTFTAER